MTKKFIRLDENGRIEELIPIPNLAEFYKTHCPEFIALGLIVNVACRKGQVYDEDLGKWVKYVKPTDRINIEKGTV